MKKSFADGRITLPEVNQRIAAWLGHATTATSDGLILKLLPEFQWFQDHPRAAEEKNRLRVAPLREKQS